MSGIIGDGRYEFNACVGLLNCSHSENITPVVLKHVDNCYIFCFIYIYYCYRMFWLLLVQRKDLTVADLVCKP